MQIEVYTGGLLETNAYYLPKAAVLIDAPQGIARVVQDRQWKVDCLFFTHGHFDHNWDGAQVQRLTKYRVGYHREDESMFLEPDLWKRFGIEEKFETLKADHYWQEGEKIKAGQYEFSVLHVPGHSPGSVCFYEPKNQVLFGGDVLFRGGGGDGICPEDRRNFIVGHS
ncbi:MAG: MBL fold metallo-hydrolase [Verrucomicrobiia bacterium]